MASVLLLRRDQLTTTQYRLIQPWTPSPWTGKGELAMKRFPFLCLVLAGLVFLGPFTRVGWSQQAVDPEPTGQGADCVS